MIIFIATVQENNKLVDSVKNLNFKVLHPFYSFNTEEGKEILSVKYDTTKYTHFWENTLRKDLFCIEHSDMVIYDFDNLPEEGRYLSMASAYLKPIIGVSEILKPSPIYFSGSIKAIMKSNQLLDLLPHIDKLESFLIKKEKKEDERSILQNT